MPLLYVNELASEAHLALDTGVDQRIRDAIDRLLARQGANGSFGLWSVGGDDAWLNSYVTDFLTRARERGFVVPDLSLKLALDRLRNYVSAAPEPAKDGGHNLAYALYVLARNGAAPVGDLRYIADTKLDDVATPIAKAQSCRGARLLGDRVRAERVLLPAARGAGAAAANRVRPPGLRIDAARCGSGGHVRDRGRCAAPTVQAAVQKVELARATLRRRRRRKMRGWCLPPARWRRDGGRCRSMSAARRCRGALYRTIKPAICRQPLRVTNTGEDQVQAVMTVTGAPMTPEPAAEKGFKIERKTYTLAGDPVDAKEVKQNTRMVVVLKITESQPQFGRVVLADYLPAGFEIDNPHLVSSGDTGTLDWISNAADPVNTEFRDDRFTAAFERKADDAPVFTVAYVVRAVAPGKYVRPQAVVEDMYRPDRYGRTPTESVEVTPAK